jgi:hypothetical protein
MPMSISKPEVFLGEVLVRGGDASRDLQWSPAGAHAVARLKRCVRVCAALEEFRQPIDVARPEDLEEFFRHKSPIDLPWGRAPSGARASVPQLPTVLPVRCGLCARPLGFQVVEQPANLFKTLLISGLYAMRSIPETIEYRPPVDILDPRIRTVSEEQPHHVEMEPGRGEPERILPRRPSSLVDGLVGAAVKEEPRR